MKKWLNTVEIGPFFVLEAETTNGKFRGDPRNLALRAAMAQCGPMQVELIQQAGDGPTVYSEMYDNGASGFHHLAYVVENMDEEIASFRAKGVEVAFIGEVGPLIFAYFDTRKQLGYYTEVLQHEPGVMAMFDDISDAAATWDGSNPIRIVE